MPKGELVELREASKRRASVEICERFRTFRGVAVLLSKPRKEGHTTVIYSKAGHVVKVGRKLAPKRQPRVPCVI